MDKRKITIISVASLIIFISYTFVKSVVIIEKTPSITLEKSLAIDATYQSAMMELPEVTGVMSRTGADELRLDPMGLYQTDNFILTKPRSEWNISLAKFEENLRKKLEKFLGLRPETLYTIYKCK